MVTIYVAALIMGITGSLHCAGMCGPIMLFLPFQHFTGIKKIASIGLYHFSRISAYAMMGLAIFSFRNVFNPVLQQYVSIVLGTMLFIAGILAFLPLGSKWDLKLPWHRVVADKLTHYMGNPRLSFIAATGFLNGLLPCGLVYLALSSTLALHSSAEAIGFMYLFGLGTMPMLLSILFFRTRLRMLNGKAIQKFTPVIVFLFSGIFLLRGLNLGIPYLSPKIQVVNGSVHSCCHKH